VAVAANDMRAASRSARLRSLVAVKRMGPRAARSQYEEGEAGSDVAGLPSDALLPRV
jgi:hypothetical protein